MSDYKLSDSQSERSNTDSAAESYRVAPKQSSVRGDTSMASDKKLFMDASGNRENSTWSPQMLRALLDYLDENKGPDGIFRTNRKQGLEGASQAIRDNVPDDFRNEVTLEQIDRKLGSMVKMAQWRGTKIKAVLLKGTEVIDLLKLPRGTYSDTELEPSRKIREERRGARTLKWKRQSEPFNTASASLPASSITKLQATISTALIKDTIGKRHVQEPMDDIRKDIEVAVLRRLEEGGGESNRPAMLKTELFGHDLCNLMATLLGCNVGSLKAEVGRLAAMQARQRLQLSHILRGLIGAALTQWILQPLFQGREEPMYRALLQVLNNGKQEDHVAEKKD